MNDVNKISILLHLGMWHVVSSLFQIILSDWSFKTFCFPLAFPVMAVNKARKSFKVSQCSAIMCVFSHRMNSAYKTYV